MLQWRIKQQAGDNKDDNGSNSGSSSDTTVTTPDDKDTTETKNVTATTPSGEKVEATVTDANGKTQYTVTTTAKNLTENAKQKKL